jgi:hypothetical protein
VNVYAAGTYIVRYNVKDTAGNAATEVTRTIEIVDGNSTDITAPVITVVVPQPSVYSSTDFTFRVLTNEQSTIQYSLDSASNVLMTEISANAFESSSLTLSAGSHSVTFYATDTAGNAATETIDFSVDLSDDAPIITVITPEEDEEYDSNITFEVNVNEIAEIEFSLNDNSNVSMDLQEIEAGILTFIYNLELNDGDYSVTFYATDTAGNTATKTVNFSVDTSSESSKKHKSKITGVTTVGVENLDDQLYLDQFSKKQVIYLTEDEKSNVENLTGWQKFLKWFPFLLVGIIILLIISMIFVRKN